MAKFLIPTPLRKFTNNESTVVTNGSTVAEALKELFVVYPEVNKHLFDNDGKFRPFIRIYVGDEDIKVLKQEQTPVKNDTLISLIPAIAGGLY